LSKKTKILAVDDEPAELQVLVETLKSVEEYEVLSAPDAEEGFRIAQLERPMLIISDYRMPRISGFEFCRMVKAHPDLKATIFVVCTAMGDVASKIEGVNLGADDYLTKPMSLDELLLRIRALLRLKALQDELVEEKAEIEKVHLELQEDFNGIINLLMKVLTLRVPGAGNRAQQASAMCEWIADRLQVDENTKRTLSLAGRLREVGKISLPDELFRTPPEKYGEAERDLAETYPVLGQLLVGDIPQLRDVAVLLRHQNENYDGTGYPDRLTATQISLGPRILRSVNLTLEFAARPASSPARVSEGLMDSLGTILDPTIGLLAEEYMRVVVDPFWKEGKRCLRLEDVREGMVIAADLITGRGIMLLSKDSKLTQSQINHIASLSHFDPIIHEIYVYDAMT
jgi:response regulator RpfG family c-di-GMP phosphodiesterase